MRRSLLLWIGIALLSGCNLFQATEHTDGLRPDVAGDVGQSQHDATSNDATSSDGSVPDSDGMQDCTSETGEQLCASYGAECGTLQVIDSCGFDRGVTCGGCADGLVCGAMQTNRCGCTAESDAEFCARLGKDCGEVTDIDNCGSSRTVVCGSCESEPCGESTPNVCGCPCDIDGVCRPEGTRSPDNQCEVCDPATSTTDWTIAVDAPCDDGNACTESDACTAGGQCAGPMADCSAFDGECRTGACDPDAGCFGADLDDGTTCTSDGDPCTDDVCQTGNCTHPAASDTCRIDGVCYASTQSNPNNPCEHCDPMTSTTDWSVRDGGCVDGDGLGCTSGTCVAGTCTALLDSGFCLINGACVSSGTTVSGDDCRVCAPSVDDAAWSNATDGIDCTTGATCESGTCQSGVCQLAQAMTSCAIDNACWSDGALNPVNPCEFCDSATATTAWSTLPSGTSCPDGDGVSCTSGSCDAGTCITQLDAQWCLISGQCVPEGQADSAQACRTCQPAVSTSSYSALADGAACNDGDGFGCTSGSCVSGQCTPDANAGSCLIAQTCYVDGDPNPANECQHCDSMTSSVGWSPVPDGSACGTSDTCNNGTCGVSNCDPNNPQPDQCVISNVCYNAGDWGSLGECYICDPATSTTSWTAATTCSGPTSACTNGGTCQLNWWLATCVPDVDPGYCYIDGACYLDGDSPPDQTCMSCDTTVSQTTWTALPGYCVIAGTCYADGSVNPNGSCEICDASVSTSFWTLRDNYCRIGGVCYAAAASNPTNVCQECNPTNSQSSWSDAPSSRYCDGASCTCHSGACKVNNGCL